MVVAREEEAVGVADVGEQRVKLRGIQVLGEELEEDVVTVGTAADEPLDLVTRGGLGHPLERHLAKVGNQEEAELAEEDQDAGDDHEDVPYPDEQVDLLVDDVDGKIAQS